jgi:hypothetical protein
MTNNSSENEIEVKNVIFLTPAKIKALVNGEEQVIMVGVDLINRKAYTGDGDSSFSDPIFNYLDAVNILPEGFFAAPEEVMREAEKADQIRHEIYNESIGGISE